jgi:hypothetical protein
VRGCWLDQIGEDESGEIGFRIRARVLAMVERRERENCER